MTKQVLTLVAIAAMFMTACQPDSNAAHGENKAPNVAQAAGMTDVPFAIAKNYFVKNTVNTLDNPKIETAEKFGEVFGMATTMGENGKPTNIDFSMQNVIAVVLPETDMDTQISPVALQKNEKGNMVLIYKSVVGQKQTFSIRPFFAIIVDKKETGPVTLKQIN